MKLFRIKKNKGFTVLFSVIVSSIVLAIGISIANITLKQIIISSAGRESQIAFYAADSGAECAIYHDLMFPEDPVFSLVAPDVELSCFGDTVEVGDFIFPGPVSAGAGVQATTTFTVTFPGYSYCATVEVGKHDYNNDQFIDKTVINSRGYNICDPNPRRLERGLEIVY